MEERSNFEMMLYFVGLLSGVGSTTVQPEGVGQSVVELRVAFMLLPDVLDVLGPLRILAQPLKILIGDAQHCITITTFCQEC